MKTCENCGHKKVCSFFNDWPNCPNWEPQLVHCGECKSWDEAVLAADIKNVPTVDAVEVVRCRDCKRWGDEDGKLHDSDGVLFARCKVHNYLIDGRHTGWCPTENDFCSYGERKEGDV